MANGRMINHAITKDLRVNRLSDDTSRLAFTWLVTFADRDGRTYGDPAIVRSMLFPRREDISIAQMTAYIQEWSDIGLVIWYEADDDKFIFFPSFEKNQRGMRPERESPSIIPQPPSVAPQEIDINGGVTPEEVRSNDGVTPDESRIKLKEVKLKEDNATTTTIPAVDGVQGEIFRKFQNEICLLTPGLSAKVGDWIDDYPADWIKDAIDEAVKNNVRKPVYIDKILKNWQAEGRKNNKKAYIPEEHASEVY